MNQKNKITNLVCLLIFLCGFLVLCAPKPPVSLDHVLSQANVNSELYRRLAVVEFSPNPQVKNRKNITDVFENELRNQGYDIVGQAEFNSVMSSFGFSNEDLSDPDVLKRVCNKLHVSAVIMGETDKYEIKKKDNIIPLVTENLTFVVGDTEYICDIALTVEMIAAREGNTVWSRSISCSRKKGKPERLIREMVRECLNVGSPE